MRDIATRPSSFSYEDLVTCAKGEMFGPGNAQLPAPPMLMFDRISEINQLRGNSEACAPAVQPGFTTRVAYAFKVPVTTDITRFVFRDQSAFRLPDADSPGVDLGLPTS